MIPPQFQHITPPLRLFSGPDSLARLGHELDRLKSRRAVIICGVTLGRDASPLDLVRAAMGGRCAGVFAGVRAHSPVPAVLAAAGELRRLDADAVIAVGGGSAIVTARAAAILLAEDADPRSLATSRDERGVMKSPRLLAPKLPQLVIPTTPTTAAVKAGSAIFDPVAGGRLALFDPKTRAQAVFIHPDMIQSAPRGLMISAALDTLSAAVEGLMSRAGNPLADAQLMHALRLAVASLPHDGLDERMALMHAAVLSGLGSDHTGGGMATVLGHAVGARHHTDNGTVKGIVLPHVLRFNAPAGLQKLALVLGVQSDVPEALEALFRQLDLPRRLRDIGVPENALPAVAALGMGDWFLRGNPRPIRDASELLGVLAAAW